MPLSQNSSAQRVHIPPFNQAMTMIQTKREGTILFALNSSVGKRAECSDARVIQNIKRKVPFQIILANFTNKKIQDSSSFNSLKSTQSHDDYNGNN